MYFSPFDLLDSPAHHGAGDYATGSDEAHAGEIDQHHSDHLCFDTHYGVEIPAAHSTHEASPNVSDTTHLFAEHDGHGPHGYEGDTTLHEWDEHADSHAISASFHESFGDSEHQVDFDATLAATDDSHALAEQGRLLESILDRHLSEAELAQLNQETGWHDSQRGTALNDFSTAIQAAGVTVERSYDTPLSDLHDALVGGDTILVGLVGPPHASFSVASQVQGSQQLETGHTALVTDIRQDDHGQWLVTVKGGATDDHGQQIPLEQFVESWDRCGRFALFAGPQHGDYEQHPEGHAGSIAASHGTASGTLVDTQGSELGGIQPGTIIGNPNHNVVFWHGQQHHTDTCAIVSQKYIIEQFTGTDIPEDVLTHEAQDHGWYLPGHGTPSMEDVGKLLDLHGIPTHRNNHATVEDLANELGQGHEVIIGVDSKDLWNARDTNPNLSPHIHGVDHAIVVSAIDTRDPEHVQVLVTDPGTGDEIARYPIEEFLRACGDGSHFSMVATSNPVPATAPEMAHFDYDKGHIDKVAGIPWSEFVKRLAVPGALAVLLGTTRKRGSSEKKNS